LGKEKSYLGYWFTISKSYLMKREFKRELERKQIDIYTKTIGIYLRK
jgi:hypothetical protein